MWVLDIINVAVVAYRHVDLKLVYLRIWGRKTEQSRRVHVYSIVLSEVANNNMED